MRLPLVTWGMTELSATRRPVDADHAALRVDHRAGIVGPAHPAGAAGVVGAFGVVAHEGVDLVVALHVRAGLQFAGRVARQRGLREDAAREADGGAEIDPVLRRRSCS